MSKRIDLIGRGRVVRFKISGNSNTNFQIDGIGALPYLDTNI